MDSLFMIWDEKVGIYLAPFIKINKGDAIRTMTEMVNNDQHLFGKNSEDFSLFEVGTFDSETGKIDVFDRKVLICGLWELKSLDANTKKEVAQPVQAVQ